MENKGYIQINMGYNDDIPVVESTMKSINYEESIIMVSHLLNKIAQHMVDVDDTDIRSEQDYIVTRLYESMVNMDTKEVD